MPHGRLIGIVAVFAGMLSTGASGADLALELARCRNLTMEERLDCYEKLKAPNETPVVPPPPPPVTKAPREQGKTVGTWMNSAPMAMRWSSDVHSLQPHKPNYVMFRQTSAPNNNPFRESNEFAPPGPGSLELDHNELKLQISVKAALSQPKWWLLGARFWIGYTQQSYWQIWNASISRPFRESNYEPEAMLVWTLGERLTDSWTLQHVVGGFVHQSNGRGDPLSRSWNRLYAQFELSHRDGLEVVVRPWFRLPEDSVRDNNIDIQRYLGYGDLMLNYRWADVDASLLVRNNLQARHNRSAFQLDLAITCLTIGQFVPKLQVFIGPGESLIDYNHRQKAIGLGVEATGWMDHTFARSPQRKCSWLPHGKT